ncbi:MAG: DUF3530 family protein [bacterium]
MKAFSLVLLAAALAACDSTENKAPEEQASKAVEVSSAIADAPVEKADAADDEFAPPKPAPATDTEPDYAREQRMIDEIADAILDGDVITLNDGKRDFAGIYMEAESDRKGGVIILHGRGFHADWADTVNPLRVGLPAHGWDTLSLQMPVLEKTAKFYEYVPLFKEAGPRIEAGIRYLRKQGVEKVVLLAHSCGAHMAMEWVEDHGDGAIDAYAGLGMGATDYKQPMLKPFPLASMKVPVLDLYGANEYPAVKRMAPERLAAMKMAGNPLSKQEVLPDADHYFSGIVDPLVESVAAWLDTLDQAWKTQQ